MKHKRHAIAALVIVVLFAIFFNLGESTHPVELNNSGDVVTVTPEDKLNEHFKKQDNVDSERSIRFMNLASGIGVGLAFLVLFLGFLALIYKDYEN